MSTARQTGPRWPVLTGSLTCLVVGLCMPILELLLFDHVSQTVAGLSAWLTAQALIVLAGGKIVEMGPLSRRSSDSGTGGSGSSTPGVSGPPSQPSSSPTGSSSTSSRRVGVDGG